MKRLLIFLFTTILLSSCNQSEFKHESKMYINNVKVAKNNKILNIVNQNNPQSIKTPLIEKPIYTIKISNHQFKIFKLQKSYAVQELKIDEILYQYEISNDEFNYVEKQIRNLLKNNQ